MSLITPSFISFLVFSVVMIVVTVIGILNTSGGISKRLMNAILFQFIVISVFLLLFNWKVI